MKESGYYPPGAEFDPQAPWNQKELPEKEIEVTVSLTISKTMTITVPDYDIEEEDGRKYYSFINSDLKRDLVNSVYLPHTVHEDLKEMLKDNPQAKTLINDLEGWVEDDLEINVED